MKVAVTSPIYIKNQIQLDCLKGLMASLHSSANALVWMPVVNYILPAFREQLYPKDGDFSIIEGRQPQSVAKAWNDAIRQAKKMGMDYILIMNQDTVLDQNAIDNIVAFAEKNVDPDIVLWTLTEVQGAESYEEHPNFSAFMVKTDFHETMGEFDENFYPAYYEDNDMHARIALNNKKAVQYMNAVFTHVDHGSMTKKHDPEIALHVIQRWPDNQLYFKLKWGIMPVNEVSEMREKYYTHPFNNPDYAINYWSK